MNFAGPFVSLSIGFAALQLSNAFLFTLVAVCTPLLKLNSASKLAILKVYIFKNDLKVVK